jgi:hypothetical protein
MSDALSFAEIDGQHVELLPARTVLSALGSFAVDQDAIAGAGGDGGINVIAISLLNSGDGSIGNGGAGGSAANVFGK